MRKLVAQFVLAFFAIVALYFLAAFLLPYWRVGGSAEKGDIAVYLVSNGVHSDVVVPWRNADFDWSSVFDPGDARIRIEPQYVAVGWGSQEFYLEARDWDQLTPKVAWQAISGTGHSALHVTYLARAPQPDERVVRHLIAAENYRELVAFIQSAQANEGRAVPIPAEPYSDYDAFYQASGRYHLFYTCNTWTGDALQATGLRGPIWTVFAAPLLRP